MSNTSPRTGSRTSAGASWPGVSFKMPSEKCWRPTLSSWCWRESRGAGERTQPASTLGIPDAASGFEVLLPIPRRRPGKSSDHRSSFALVSADGPTAPGIRLPCGGSAGPLYEPPPLLGQLPQPGSQLKVLKLNALDLQPLKSRLLVPFGNSGRLVFRAFRLRQNKPMGLVGEMREGEFLFLFGAVLFGYSPCALARERHTKCQRLLALLYV